MLLFLYAGQDVKNHLMSSIKKTPKKTKKTQQLSHSSCCSLIFFGKMLNVSLPITCGVITNNDQQMAALMH